MNNQELENLLHQLKPATLPEDLQNRLSAEPGRTQSPRKKQGLVLVSGLAAGVAVFLGIMIDWSPEQNTASDAVVTASDGPAPPVPRQPAASNEMVTATDRPVSVVKKDSTLLKSQLLTITEYEGELWEISEEKWRDDTLVLYSAGPSKLNATVIRREVVCSPLTFQ